MPTEYLVLLVHITKPLPSTTKTLYCGWSSLVIVPTNSGALSFLSDGFKTIGIGVNLFTGTLYGLAAVWYELKSVLSWGDVKEKAIADMEAMRAKSQEYFDKGFDGAKNLESKTIEAIQNIGKTDKEKNQERIADSQQTLDQLKTQEEKHKVDYKAIRDSAYGIGDGYRNAGSIAREEAKSSSEAWSEAVAAASEQFDAEMKRQSKSLSEGIYNYDSYSRADVISQLKSKGYNDKEAEKLAASIWSKAMEADRDAKAEGLTKGGNPALKLLIEQEFNNAASKGLTTQHGTNKINDLLRQMSSNNLVSTGSTSKAPAVDVNSLAPQVSTPVPSATENVTTKNSRIELVSGNKTATLTGSQQDVDTMEEIMREFEMLKRST